MRRLIIELPVRSEWSNVELIRTAILNCFAAVFNDLDSCRALATVISELLENAIKYGAWDRAEDQMLHLAITSDGARVLVSVEHPVEPASPHLATLVETLAWLKGFASPAEAYRARLSELADRPPDEGVSRLGLARISYEANCALSAEVKGRTLQMLGVITQ
jgi:hypothetical protein